MYGQTFFETYVDKHAATYIA